MIGSAKARRWLPVVFVIGLAVLLPACAPQPTMPAQPDDPPTPSPSPPPTPATEVLQVGEAQTSGARLRVTVRSITVSTLAPDQKAQVFAVLTEPQGAYAYLIYPANRAGDRIEQLDLTESPLQIGLGEESVVVTLWLLAVHNTSYHAAEDFGLESLASSLAIGFRTWLASGDPSDDPLAAVVSRSEGALFEWFASIEVLGQSITDFKVDMVTEMVLASLHSPDAGLSAVYAVEIVPANHETTFAVFEEDRDSSPYTFINRFFPGGNVAFCCDVRDAFALCRPQPLVVWNPAS